jgi:hypothetical protein
MSQPMTLLNQDSVIKLFSDLSNFYKSNAQYLNSLFGAFMIIAYLVGYVSFDLLTTLGFVFLLLVSTKVLVMHNTENENSNSTLYTLLKCWVAYGTIEVVSYGLDSFTSYFDTVLFSLPYHCAKLYFFWNLLGDLQTTLSTQDRVTTDFNPDLYKQTPRVRGNFSFTLDKVANFAGNFYFNNNKLLNTIVLENALSFLNIAMRTMMQGIFDFHRFVLHVQSNVQAGNYSLPNVTTFVNLLSYAVAFLNTTKARVLGITSNRVQSPVQSAVELAVQTPQVGEATENVNTEPQTINDKVDDTLLDSDVTGQSGSN